MNINAAYEADQLEVELLCAEWEQERTGRKDLLHLAGDRTLNEVVRILDALLEKRVQLLVMEYRVLNLSKP